MTYHEITEQDDQEWLDYIALSQMPTNDESIPEGLFMNYVIKGSIEYLKNEMQ